MHLSKFTDYSFRILIFLGHNQNGLFTVDELSSILNLSPHHTKKVIYKLSKNDYVVSLKGRNGGIKLVKDPSEINLRDVFEKSGENLNIIECFSENNTCNIKNNCKLKPILNQSLEFFLLSLSKYTLKDIL